MALRDNMDSSGGVTSSSTSALAGLPAFWDSPKSPSKTEWGKVVGQIRYKCS